MDSERRRTVFRDSGEPVPKNSSMLVEDGRSRHTGCFWGRFGGVVFFRRVGNVPRDVLAVKLADFSIFTARRCLFHPGGSVDRFLRQIGEWDAVVELVVSKDCPRNFYRYAPPTPALPIVAKVASNPRCAASVVGEPLRNIRIWK